METNATLWWSVHNEDYDAQYLPFSACSVEEEEEAPEETPKKKKKKKKDKKEEEPEEEKEEEEEVAVTEVGIRLNLIYRLFIRDFHCLFLCSLLFSLSLSLQSTKKKKKKKKTKEGEDDEWNSGECIYFLF